MKESDYLQDNIEIINKLKKLPIMGALEDKYIHGLVKLCKVMQYEPGEVIFAEDGFDQHIFFLISGKVKIVKKGIEVSTLSTTGDIFGEMGIIDAAARSASVQAVDLVNCLQMDVSYVDRLPDKEKETCLYVIYRVFTEILSDRLRRTTEELAKAKEEIGRLKGK